MALTERTERLIDAAAELGTSLAEKLGESGLGFLVWASPIGSRSPEEAEVWHPGYDKGYLSRAVKCIFSAALSSLKGLWRFFGYTGFYYVRINKNGRALLIIPDTITDRSAQYGTSYLAEDEGFSVDKLVFSRSTKIGDNFTALSHFKKLKYFMTIGGAIIMDIFEKIRNGKVDIYYLDMLATFLEWFLSQAWYFHVDLYALIRNTLSSGGADYKALIAVHEMHFYSKIVWKVAEEKGILGVTAQHAMIIPEKLWYFPHKMEIDAGFSFPDIFFVYSEETKSILKKGYPEKTRFPLCYSPRFKKWKDIKNVSRHPETGRGKSEFVLFAGGLTPYDTTSLLEAISNLCDLGHSGKGMKVRYRLHPHARIKLRDKIQIRKAVSSKKFELSKGSLMEDLGKSALVIGAYTLVLRQAALMGIPVLSMRSENYIQPSVLPRDEKWNATTRGLSWERITRQINTAPDSDMKKTFLKDLGMENQEFSTKLVYSACGIDQKKD